MADLSQSNIPDVVQFPSGTKQWFYQAAAPTGWTIDTTLGDAVLAVHGASTYDGSTGGGQQKGTWTQPNHSHQWLDYTTNSDDYSWNSGGALIDIWASGGDEADGPGIIVRVDGADEKKTAKDWYTNAQATVNTWRPKANVGIIASKD